VSFQRDVAQGFGGVTLWVTFHGGRPSGMQRAHNVVRTGFEKGMQGHGFDPVPQMTGQANLAPLLFDFQRLLQGSSEGFKKALQNKGASMLLGVNQHGPLAVQGANDAPIILLILRIAQESLCLRQPGRLVWRLVVVVIVILIDILGQSIIATITLERLLKKRLVPCYGIQITVEIAIGNFFRESARCRLGDCRK
jgi:hypothetical protein